MFSVGPRGSEQRPPRHHFVSLKFEVCKRYGVESGIGVDHWQFTYVFWLGRFVASTEVSFSNSLLECLDCQIGFHGYRGGSVPSLAASPDLKRKLAVEVPSVCILSVGGNDLDHAGPPQTLLVGIIIIRRRRTFIKRHKSGNIHSEALYMSRYTCVVEL